MNCKTPMSWIVYMERWTLAQIIKCKIYTQIKRNNKLFDVKWDFLCKHAYCKKALKNIKSNVKENLVFFQSL
jgi:hypothetical protein